MTKLTCPNPDCRVAETGKCVEGFPVKECPHQQKIVSIENHPVADVNNEESQQEPTPASRSTSLTETSVASGEILSIGEATDILRKRSTRVLTVIGPNKSGKTTLGISLYDFFQHASFDRWSFNGSMTLPAFEKRCHHARSQCGGSSPETQRTSRSEGLGFLHLALHSHDSGRIDLLISDRSGEFYTAIADNLEDCESLHEVSRADHVIFLVDGEKLASDERHGVINDVRMIIATLMEEEKIGVNQRVGIILTKYDIVFLSKFKERVDRDFENLVNQVEENYGGSLAEIKSFKIAARSELDTFEPCYGVLDILEQTLRRQHIVKHIAPSVSEFSRSFLQLQETDRRGE
ncbi:TRAFAC clade GTPase domain-containing protein [Desulfogranum marinum]|uniref:TRAFAC clade GTPase domain-containing protein n=1 Tax=Desulfogranum marinum TaxID=453220 RepID=UPI001965D18B|nr:hypothetical protein [Desulfogranum marinum]MBM9514279.1 hypothetical protein [Desulfogranum marinum]